MESGGVQQRSAKLCVRRDQKDNIFFVDFEDLVVDREATRFLVRDHERLDTEALKEIYGDPRNPIIYKGKAPDKHKNS